MKKIFESISSAPFESNAYQENRKNRKIPVASKIVGNSPLLFKPKKKDKFQIMLNKEGQALIEDTYSALIDKWIEEYIYSYRKGKKWNQSNQKTRV